MMSRSKTHLTILAFMCILFKVSQAEPIHLSICSDDYKINNYKLQCEPGLKVQIVDALEIFNYQGVLPECSSDGYKYNYSTPFRHYCDGKELCPISSTFLDDNKLFSGETYFLKDPALYIIPFRIDVSYMCLSYTPNTLAPTTERPGYQTTTTGTTSTTTMTTTKLSSTSTRGPTTTSTTTITTTTAISTTLTSSPTTLTHTITTSTTTTTTSASPTTVAVSSNNKKMSIFLNSDLVSLDEIVLNKTVLQTNTLSTGEDVLLVNNTAASSTVNLTSLGQTKPAIALSSINAKNTPHVTDIIDNIIKKVTSSYSSYSASNQKNLENTENKSQIVLVVASNDDEIKENDSASTAKAKKIHADFKNNNFSKIFKITKFKNLIINDNNHLKDAIEQERKIAEKQETKTSTLQTTQESSKMIKQLVESVLGKETLTSSTKELGLNKITAEQKYTTAYSTTMKSTITTNNTNIPTLSLEKDILNTFSSSLSPSSSLSSLSTADKKAIKEKTTSDVNKNSKILFFTSILKTVAPLIKSSSLSYTSSVSNSFSITGIANASNSTEHKTNSNETSITSTIVHKTDNKNMIKLWSPDQEIYESTVSDEDLPQTTAFSKFTGNSDTDKTIMIVLIVVGIVLFFIIIGIIVLICIKRKNRKGLENDFNYRPDKINESSIQFGGLNGGDINTIDSKGNSQAYTSTYQPQASLSTHEVCGTYRSNSGYDNTDRSMVHNDTGYIIQKANRSLFEQEEYWRTNI